MTSDYLVPKNRRDFEDKRDKGREVSMLGVLLVLIGLTSVILLLALIAFANGW